MAEYVNGEERRRMRQEEDKSKPGATEADRQDALKALDDLDALLHEYIHFPDERQRWAVVAWTALTHAIDATVDGEYIFDIATYLWVKSAGRNSGKTTLSYMLAWASHNGKHSSSMTASAFYRQENGRITPFFDEADNIFRASRGDDSETANLLKVINGGSTRGGSVDRTSKMLKSEDFDIFGPKAIIGISVPIPDTTSSRCIHIELVRAKTGEVPRKFRRRTVMPRASAVSAVLAVVLKRLSVPMPPDDGLPELDFIVNRDYDVWEPLLLVAQAVGGHWPSRVIEAAKYLTKPDQTMSLGEQLLADVLSLFEQADADFMSTSTLLGQSGGTYTASMREESFSLQEGLLGLSESPWATYRRTKPMNAHDLASLLKPYGIEPDYEEPGRRRGLRGYFRADIVAAAGRWLNTEADEGLGRSPSTASTATAASTAGDDPHPPAGIDWDLAERATDDYGKAAVPDTIDCSDPVAHRFFTDETTGLCGICERQRARA